MLFALPELSEADAQVLAAIDEMRQALRFSLSRPRRWRGTLRRQSLARAVRGSNSIEGIEVTDDEALAIVSGESDQVSIDPTWLAVKGYSDAMTYLHAVARRPGAPLDESTLLALHFMVQSYDLDRRPGEYRRGEIFVRDDDAREVVYAGPEPADVPGLMAEYTQDLARLAGSGVHPLLQGAMAHLNLVMIHPFADGNGRMSRIVQSFMLYREQVDEAELVSIEEHLGRSAQAYYDVLARVGGGQWSPQRDASEWIEFVLAAHYRQVRTVQRRIWVLDRIAEKVDELVDAGRMPARSSAAMELALSGWRIRNATYRDLAEVSANVASRELNALVDAGLLKRHGQKRGTWYSPADDLAAWIDGVQAQAAARFEEAEDPYRMLRRGGRLVPASAAS